MKSLRRHRASVTREPAPEPAPEAPEPAPEHAARVDLVWVAAVAIVTVAWAAVTVAGWDLRFDTTGRGTAAATAAAALTGAAWRPRSDRAAALAVVGLIVFPLGLAQAAGGSSALLGATLVAAAAVEVVRALRPRLAWRWTRMVPAMGLLAAAACLIVAMAVDGGEGLSRALPSDGLGAALLGVAAGVLLVFVASFGPCRARPLAVAGMLVALVAVSGLSASAVAGTAAAAATLLALRAPARPAAAIAALAVAAAAVPAGDQASGLLAGAAALGLAFPHPAAALLAIPGAAALAAALVGDKVEWPLVMVVLGTAATALALGQAVSAKAALPRGRPALRLLPACGLAVWLVLSPGSWGWTGDTGLGTYDRGASLALAAALLAVVGGRVRALSSRPAP